MDNIDKQSPNSAICNYCHQDQEYNEKLKKQRDFLIYFINETFYENKNKILQHWIEDAHEYNVCQQLDCIKDDCLCNERCVKCMVPLKKLSYQYKISQIIKLTDGLCIECFQKKAKQIPAMIDSLYDGLETIEHFNNKKKKWMKLAVNSDDKNKSLLDIVINLIETKNHVSKKLVKQLHQQGICQINYKIKGMCIVCNESMLKCEKCNQQYPNICIAMVETLVSYGGGYALQYQELCKKCITKKLSKSKILSEEYHQILKKINEIHPFGYF